MNGASQKHKQNERIKEWYNETFITIFSLNDDDELMFTNFFVRFIRLSNFKCGTSNELQNMRLNYSNQIQNSCIRAIEQWKIWLSIFIFESSFATHDIVYYSSFVDGLFVLVSQLRNFSYYKFTNSFSFDTSTILSLYFLNVFICQSVCPAFANGHFKVNINKCQMMNSLYP